MDKNEILQKSRMENEDEGMLAAKNKGALLGKRIMAVMCMVIILISFILERQIKVGHCVVLAVFNSFLIGENIEEYRFTKKSSDLLAIIMYSVITLGWLALFIFCLVSGK